MAGYAEQRRGLTDRLIAALVRLFTGMDSYRDADARRFVRQAVPLVRAAQISMADLVATHVTADASVALGSTLAPVELPRQVVTDLRGVDPRQVYLRPVITVRTALAEDRPLAEAIELGATRLREVAEGDMQLAHAHASREAMHRLPARAQPRLWRRVLVGAENCALCVIAASHRYTRDDLNPIHPGCDCEVRPIWGADTTATEDDARMERAHQAVQKLTGRADRGGRAVDYRQLITQDHGELGPMLVNPRDRFTGPEQIPRRATS